MLACAAILSMCSVVCASARSAGDCAALQKEPEVCVKTSQQLVCFQVAMLLHLRKRLTRLMMLPELPRLLPSSDEYAQLQIAAAAVLDMDLVVGCVMTMGELHLFLAVLCAGILQAEAAVTPGSVRARMVAPLHNASELLLRTFLTCPWETIADTGWPVFWLLARLARHRAAAEVPNRITRGCPSDALISAALASPTLHGLPHARSGRLGSLLPEISTVRTFMGKKSLLRLVLRASGHRDRIEARASILEDVACLWEAADRFLLSGEAVCVAEVAPGIDVALFAARDCNAHWPACGSGITGSSLPHFWMQPPKLRDVVVEKIREEQRPYCSLSQPLVDGHVSGENRFLEQVGTALGDWQRREDQRHFSIVEVGANYGDCTLLVSSLANQAHLPFMAIIFEANPDILPFLRGNLWLNPFVSGNAEVRELLVGAPTLAGGMHEKGTLVVPPSSVHAHGRNPGEYIASWNWLESGRVFQVGTTTLDQEIGDNALVDILLLNVNGGEVEVLAGAARLLSEQAICRVILLTESLQKCRYVLESQGYHVDVPTSPALVASNGPEVLYAQSSAHCQGVARRT